MMNVPSSLTDEQLTAEVSRLAACERSTVADLIAHLAELDARELYLGAGFSSLFIYCREVLHLSEDGACTRIAAAHAAQRFPAILEMLSDGRLNLSTLRLLAPHLADDHEQLLSAAVFKSKSDIKELIARRFPRPDVATAIRKLPEPGAVCALVAKDVGPGDRAVDVGRREKEADDPVAPAATQPAAPSGSPPRRPLIEPLAEGRYLIKFTASAAMLAKLRHAQDLLRHALPGGDAAEIFDRALTALVQDLEKAKFAATDRPRASRGSKDASRDVPAAVKRAVWLRDDGQCAFAGHGGRRCEERGFLEFHHLTPYIASGEATVENIALRCALCRAHNQYEADLFFAPIRAGMSARLSIRLR